MAASDDAQPLPDLPPLPELPPLSAQVDRLIALEVPQRAGVDEDVLRQAAEQWGPDRHDALMALSPEHAPASTLTSLLGWDEPGDERAEGASGSAILDMVDLDEAGPAEIDLPDGAVYLVHDPDHGDDLANLTPAEALTTIAAQGRSPMVLTEALHWVLQQPEILEQGHSSMTLGSLLRRPGGFFNQRVPAVWSGSPGEEQSTGTGTGTGTGNGDPDQDAASPGRGGGREHERDQAAGSLSWRWWGSRHHQLGAATASARTPVPSA